MTQFITLLTHFMVRIDLLSCPQLLKLVCPSLHAMTEQLGLGFLQTRRHTGFLSESNRGTEIKRAGTTHHYSSAAETMSS